MNRSTQLFAAIGLALMTSQVGAQAPIKIVGLVELSGTGATSGTNFDNGVKLAVKEINAAGGILGRQVQYTSGDTQSNPGVAKALAQKAIDDGAYVVMGPVFSGSILVSMLETQRAEVPNFTGGEAAAITQKGNPYIFRTSFTQTTAMPKVARYIKNGLKAKVVDIMWVNNDFGKGGRDMIIKSLESEGIKVGADISTDPGQVDFSSAVLKAKQSNGDALFVYTNEEESARALRELRKQGYAKPIVGETVLTSQKVIELAGEAANGAVAHVGLTADAPLATIRQVRRVVPARVQDARRPQRAQGLQRHVRRQGDDREDRQDRRQGVRRRDEGRAHLGEGQPRRADGRHVRPERRPRPRELPRPGSRTASRSSSRRCRRWARSSAPSSPAGFRRSPARDLRRPDAAGSAAMGDLIQLIVSGTATGAIYALAALGFTLLWQAAGVINFAQGEFVMLPAFAMLFGIAFGMPLWLAFLFACALAALVLGFGFKRGIVDPLIRHGVIPLVIATLGLVDRRQVDRARRLQRRGASVRESRSPRGSSRSPASTSPGPTSARCSIAGAIVIGLQAFLNKTVTGRAMQAVAQNTDAARVLGIDVKRMVMYVVPDQRGAGGRRRAAVTPTYLAKFDMGDSIGQKAFFAAIIGGFNQTRGALLGGVLIGVLENLVGFYISPAYKEGVALMLFLLVILFRPEGLLGKAEERKV